MCHPLTYDLLYIAAQVVRGIPSMREGASHDEKGPVDALFAACYEELHLLAKRHMRMERNGHTLRTTGLLHNVYLKLAGSERFKEYDRKHFFAIAARAMKQVLIDHARSRNARAGRFKVVGLDAVEQTLGIPVVEVGELTEALDRLETDAPNGERKRRLMELVYLEGMTVQEAAEILDIGRRTAHRDFAYSKTWLRRELEPGPGEP